MTERTTSSSWVAGIVAALEYGGLNGQSLFTQLGLDYESLNNPEARFPQDAMTRLWLLAVELSGDPAIGLNMARALRPSSFNVVGYALMSSRNLQEGIVRMVRYQRIIAEGADISFQPAAEGYEISLAIHGDRIPAARQSAEASLAYSVAFYRWVTGKPLRPRYVRLMGPAPQNLAPYNEVFQCPISFNAAHYALAFERADLEAPLPSANEALAQLHDRFAGDYLARFSGSRVTHQVRQVLCRLLPQGEPKREVVAQALLLSERTLQRRLQDEGSSYQQLLDDTRRELAMQYLDQANLTLLEISYLLGFSDPSNFFRAFRRWFATTPGEYRARLHKA